MLSYPGQTVNLRCAFTDATGIQLTMVRNRSSKLSLRPEILLKCKVVAPSAGWTLPEVISTTRRQYSADTAALKSPLTPQKRL